MRCTLFLITFVSHLGWFEGSLFSNYLKQNLQMVEKLRKKRSLHNENEPRPVIPQLRLTELILVSSRRDQDTIN